uniref:Glycosyltransferase n=1 Tax=viral metagenome TaxID=1070528 RepID=A0A6C0I1S3_9ZZZZ
MSTKYAWCMLVIGDIEDGYLIGALVCAKSLKEQHTQYPIILMVTEEIWQTLQKNETIYNEVFDSIVIVPIIEHPTLEFKSERQKEMYEHWINKSFTKWNCLTLTEYNKVILLDADMVFTSNCDELFELRAPAGCFSQPWAFPYQKHGALYNPYIKSNKRWLLNRDIPHGATIKACIIRDTIFTKKSPTFAVGAFMVLLEPNIEDYTLLLDIIKSQTVYGKNMAHFGGNTIRSISGSDETAISLLYSYKNIDFTHIHQKFAAAMWKHEWVPSGEERAIHYFGKTKPWNMHIEEYPDLQIWWNIADLLCIDERFKLIFYPPYTPSLLDIAVAEYELAKDIQKLIVTFFTPTNGGEINKKLLWDNAKKIVSCLLEPLFSSSSSIDIDTAIISYPLWSKMLITEYNYEKFKFLKIAATIFTKLLNTIKLLVSKRIQIRLREVKIKILTNEIACGNHIKISKGSKYNIGGDDSNLIPLIIEDIYLKFK